MNKINSSVFYSRIIEVLSLIFFSLIIGALAVCAWIYLIIPGFEVSGKYISKFIYLTALIIISIGLFVMSIGSIFLVFSPKKKLRIKRYKNYGCMLQSENKPESLTKFHWSFYELNNYKTYSLQYIEYFKKNKLINTDFEVSYTEQKLNNGNTINYKFGNAKAIDANEMSKEFFEWFDNLPTVKDLIDNFDPNIDEEKCVKDFYLKNIETKKDIQTDTIEVNNKMKRYLQLFSGLICILIGICFLALQNGVYLTTWYAVMASIFIPIGLLILGNLEKKNFFSRTSFFFNKIYGWRNRKYEGIFLYITFIIISLLFVGLILLVGNIIQ